MYTSHLSEIQFILEVCVKTVIHNEHNVVLFQDVTTVAT